MRGFEKISFEQFKKDVKDDIAAYNQYALPSRNSKSAAGYDFYLLDDIIIEPNQILKLPTGVKSYFEADEVLFLFVRSSMGFKYNIRLCNQVGVVDADYYNNANNEGHLWIRIQNESDNTISFSKGQAIVQGVFMKYLKADSDNGNDKERSGNY